MRQKVYSKIDSIPGGMAQNGPVVPAILLLEGGAFRSVYTMGVLDYWMQQGLCLSTVVGVSAGGLTGLAYHCGYIGRCARINLRYRHDRRYVGLGNLPRCRSFLRLEFLFKDYTEIEPFDYNLINQPGRRLIVEVSNCLNGRAEFLELGKCPDIFQAVTASASLPYISPMVKINDIPYLDGGCVSRLPYKWARQLGPEKMVVVRTREPSFRKKVGKAKFAAKFYHNYPEFAAALDNTNAEYNESCEQLEKLSASGEIFVQAPSEQVEVSRLEGDMEKLGHLYWLGYQDAQSQFSALLNFLGVSGDRLKSDKQ